jgi:hypothetical protein
VEDDTHKSDSLRFLVIEKTVKPPTRATTAAAARSFLSTITTVSRSPVRASFASKSKSKSAKSTSRREENVTGDEV